MVGFLAKGTRLRRCLVTIKNTPSVYFNQTPLNFVIAWLLTTTCKALNRFSEPTKHNHKIKRATYCFCYQLGVFVKRTLGSSTYSPPQTYKLHLVCLSPVSLGLGLLLSTRCFVLMNVLNHSSINNATKVQFTC